MDAKNKGLIYSMFALKCELPMKNFIFGFILLFTTYATAQTPNDIISRMPTILKPGAPVAAKHVQLWKNYAPVNSPFFVPQTFNTLDAVEQNNDVAITFMSTIEYAFTYFTEKTEKDRTDKIVRSMIRTPKVGDVYYTKNLLATDNEAGGGHLKWIVGHHNVIYQNGYAPNKWGIALGKNPVIMYGVDCKSTIKKFDRDKVIISHEINGLYLSVQGRFDETLGRMNGYYNIGTMTWSSQPLNGYIGMSAAQMREWGSKNNKGMTFYYGGSFTSVPFGYSFEHDGNYGSPISLYSIDTMRKIGNGDFVDRRTL